MSKEPTNSEFIEGARAFLLRQGANDAQWEFATLLRKACDRLDKATQQPSSKFTKRFREFITLSEDHSSKSKIGRLRTYGREACAIIDTSAQQRKDLLEVLKELAATFVGLTEGSIGGQAMKKANDAIDNFER